MDNNGTAVIPTIVGHTSYEYELAAVRKPSSYIGYEAQSRSEDLGLGYPIEHGIITNWGAMEQFWREMFNSELYTSPDTQPVTLTETPLNPQENRAKTSQIMFETFHVTACYVAIQSVLSLYASGHTTGVVLESGDGVTHAMPIYEGSALTQATFRLDWGGRTMTNYLNDCLRNLGHPIIAGMARDLKEKIS
ncbi:actin [Dimargaris cristalligena]|nr:actin [Dimargaris cristalligena]